MTSKTPGKYVVPSSSNPDRRDALGDFISGLASELRSHPGFMWTNEGFEVLHADWPAYPQGHGVEICLHSLAEYPLTTKFFPVDGIDRSTLFVVGRKPNKDPYGAQHLHVAVWDDDLLQCESLGYVEGVLKDGDFLRFPNGFTEVTKKGGDAATIDLILGPTAESLEPRILEFSS